MTIAIKPGARVWSTVCDTELIIVHAPDEPVDLTIGGAAAAESVDKRDANAQPTPGFDGGTMIGKRYVDEAGTIELLCTKPGAGAPAVKGELLTIKSAKPLPASD